MFSCRRILLSCFACLVAFAAAALALPAATSAQNTALVPAPFQPERHEGFLEEAKAGGIDCLLMGDSITDWWRRAGAGLYEQLFEPLRCANFGIAGDRTQGVLWRMENGELDGYSPKLMMLMIGTRLASTCSSRARLVRFDIGDSLIRRNG